MSSQAEQHGQGCEGVDGVGEIPRERWNVDDFYDADAQAPGKMNTRRAALLARVDEFDARFFGISPREAVRLDPQQRILLEVAWEALEDAGQVPEQLVGSRSGVFVGVMSNDYSMHVMGDPREVDPYTVTGTASCLAANRLSYFFGFTGPSMAVDTACSSSLVAVRLACQSLRSGETELALAGGVNVILAPEGSVWLTKVGLSSPDGRCKVFDASANGFVRGEGAGVVVLKTLSRARADSDSIYAVIRGGAVNQSGRTNGLMAPSRWAQEAVLREAYRDAGVSPADIHYVETHSTGTSFGDPIEASALGAVRAEAATPAAAPCVIGSVKTNIGHLEAASGIAGLIKVALMLKRREIPPNLHFSEPNPHINLEELGLRVPRELGRWPDGATPLRAGVSAFGFGGANAHVVVEEAPAEEGSEETREGACAYFLPISARGPEALRAHAQAHREMLSRADAPRADALRDICYTAGARRAHHDYRLGLTGGTREELVEGLDAFLRGESAPGVSAGRKISSRRVKIVFAFADELGEGSEVARELSEQEPAFAEALARCDAAFRASSGQSVLEELRASSSPVTGEARTLKPRVLFSLQVALASLWRAWGVEPDSVLGVGVGEVAAAHVAGTSSLEESARVVSQVNRLDVRPLPERALEALTKERNLTFLLMGGRAEFGGRVADYFQGRGRQATVLPSLRGAEGGRASMLDSLAALYCAGARVDWGGLYADGGRLVRLPSYPWQRERFWIERRRPAPSGARDEEAAQNNGAASPDWRARVRALKADERQAFTEEFLREEAAKVLGLAPERLDAQTSLNALGIDSLMAMELRNRVEKSAGVVLPVVNLLRGPSVSEVATYLLENLTGEAGAVSAREGDGRAGSSHAEGARGADGHAGPLYPLSHNQRSLWFMQQLAPESPAYNLMMAWCVRSEVDAAAMRRACQKVIDRHASLRTTYTTGDDGAPLQHVHASAPVCFETADVSGMGDAELSALVADRAHRPFDLQRGPLLRFELFTRSAREHVLLLSVHHIVVDFGSVAILMDELFKLYREEAGGAPAVLDPPGASYTDYV
ncbi:MAG: condensation domain-containing protein, partial [Acidobacteria bacterium]|nr:condensation domain-containing protein [Acidobacteriota bacterium]